MRININSNSSNISNISNKSSSHTRWAVVARSTGKILKNAQTREQARLWKRNSGKSGLGILDRNSDKLIN